MTLIRLAPIWSTTALAVTLAVSSVSAQQPSQPQMAASAPRLSVRPHVMATGTRTVQAGLQQMDSFPGYYVYTPPQCVGTRRAPLIVLLHGGGRSSTMEIRKFRSLADKYGIIVLLPNASDPGRWDMIYGGMANAINTEAGLKVSKIPEQDVRNIDAAMKQVLRTYAIDPDRIALLGFSDGGSSSLLLGRSNQDVFSRIAALSALIPFDATGPQNPKTQFFLSGGIAEDMVKQTLKLAQVIRHEGHPVQTLLGLRGHVDYVADEDFVWRWLTLSWADPGITTHIITPADSDPVLTVDAFTRITAFWTHFMQEPDSIRNVGRMMHQMQLHLALGAQPVSVITMDMPAMAAAYPLIATDLRVAGLTAQQEAAYRAAILRVEFAHVGGITTTASAESMLLGRNLPFDTIVPTSVLGQNLEFRHTHETEFRTLEKMGMWVTQ